jgi:ABC-type amino acid transport substrate-binding protein
VALVQGEIDGLVAEEQTLLRVSQSTSDLVRILDEPVTVEPRAIAVRRQDVNMRNLLNHTIQYLTASGELEVLFSEYFPGQDFPSDIIYLWGGIGDDAPVPAQYATGIQYPAQATMPRVLQSGTLRVAGILDLPSSPTESDIRFDALNRNLVTTIAQRWGVSLQIVPSTPEMGVDMLNNGQADLVVGIQPDWQLFDRADFTTPYLLHGDRLMVPTRSTIEGFNDLRGQWVATMMGDDTARQRVQEWADSINATVNLYDTTERDAALTLLQEANADVVYANNLALIPHLEAYPNDLRLTDRWYSREYFGIAVPRNDIDFRLLVDYTLQELIVDGTLERLSRPLILSDDLPTFDIWPGASEYAGVTLSSS